MTGTSMTPTLVEGMELELLPVTRGLRRGDVVVFPNGETLVAHRVVGRTGSHVQTAGDAQPHIVENVSPDSIVGRVSQHTAASARGAVLSHARPLRALWSASRLRIHAIRERDLSARLFLNTVFAAVCGNDELVRHIVERHADAILRIASEERCLVYLRSHAREVVDAQINWREEIRRQVAAASLQNNRLRREALSIVRAFADRNIPSVLLKGAARAVADPEAWRHPSSDVDVLVPSADAAAAVSALASLGYCAQGEPANYTTHHHEVPLMSPTGIVVEVHTALARGRVQHNAFGWETLQRYACTVDAKGPVKVLDEAASVYHLLVHSLEELHVRDLALAAESLRRSPQIIAEVRAMIAQGSARTRLNALLDFACRLAGIEPASRGAERWLSAWLQRRFGLPPKLQPYSQMIDATLVAFACEWRDATDTFLSSAGETNGTFDVATKIGAPWRAPPRCTDYRGMSGACPALGRNN